MKILDLTMNLPGPYMTWLMTTLGAEVIKIENPVGGDYARNLLRDPSTKRSPYFEAVNRNKKSVTLNLKHHEGRQLFFRLLDHYDIVVEGFRPGTMERLELSYDVMAHHQPRLIQVSISGYGQDGPYRLRAGHDLNYLALAGIIGMSGSSDGPPPLFGIQVADLAGGSLLGLVGLLAAVIQRGQTGRGQYVDTSMFHGSLSMATMVFGGVERGIELPEPGKMALNGRFPCYNIYRAKDGRFMSLGALEPKFWQNFCQAIGREDLTSGQFGGPDVIRDVERVFAERTQSEWTALLKDCDACCEPVLSLHDAVNSELTEARHMVSEADPGHRQLGSPLKLSDSPVQAESPSPGLGAHTKEILSRIGVSEDHFQDLRSKGVV